MKITGNASVYLQNITSNIAQPTTISPQLAGFLNRKVEEFNQPSFIGHDPISIPHLFTCRQDVEIAAFFAAIFAWGNRAVILNKCRELLAIMHHAPYDFVRQHQPKDLQPLLTFKHRTFNATDVLYFIEFLQFHYAAHNSLEAAFLHGFSTEDDSTEKALDGFHRYVFSMEHAPARTRKHIGSPANKSTCKRMSMFLRWMVRKDSRGVDFGLWQCISPAQLICPLDVHVARVARGLGLLLRPQNDWQAALELTHNLRLLDRDDPVKYDFALFGTGVNEK